LIPYAAGSLYSSAEDLLVWDQALCTNKLLTQRSRDDMFTPFKSNYAYGWSVGKRFDHASISHGGDIYGFSAQITRFPDDRVTVIVLSNIQGASTGKVADALSAIVFGAKYDLPREHKAINLAQSVLDQYVGEYMIGTSTTLTVAKEGDKLMLSIPAQPKMQ